MQCSDPIKQVELCLLSFTQFRYVTNGKYYQDSLKGMFCAKTNISLIIQDNQDHRELSIKPFLMQIWIGLMFLGLVYFFFLSALNYRLNLSKAKIEHIMTSWAHLLESKNINTSLSNHFKFLRIVNQNEHFHKRLLFQEVPFNQKDTVESDWHKNSVHILQCHPLKSVPWSGNEYNLSSLLQWIGYG